MTMSPGMEDTRLATDSMQVARKVDRRVVAGGELCTLAIYQEYKLCGS